MSEAPPYQRDAPDTPDSADFYVTDLTLDDVRELEAFTRARCDEIYSRYQPTAPEARMVQAFWESAGVQIHDLRERVAARRPEALGDLGLAWDCLIHVMAPWRDTPGYNTARWRTIPYESPLEHARARRRQR
ncbi:hypothetical protein [Streptomyces scopuliridis]|uniref:hypothetical protein n=1 Tax=Streptomyces scopuliridis TaxID=452529 RepID=UPI00344735E3